MDFKVHTNGTLYEWDKTGVFGTVYGEIYIEIYGTIFPHKEWIDIISSVLIMWTEVLIEILLSKSNDVKEFYFMDGPYNFTITKKNNNIVYVDLLKSNKKTTEKPYEITFDNLSYKTKESC